MTTNTIVPGLDIAETLAVMPTLDGDKMNSMQWFSRTYRKVLFDFHTGDCVTELLTRFDAPSLVAQLQDAGVQAISICAKDHHGHAYYPTKVGYCHPSLKRDMIGEFTTSAHNAGMRVVNYLSVGWDNWAAAQHPEWRQVNKDGEDLASPALSIAEYRMSSRGRWKSVCHNTGYGDYVLAQAEELFRSYPLDGLWLDILGYGGDACFCDVCRADFAQWQDENSYGGLSVEQQEALHFVRWKAEKRRAFIKRIRDLADTIRPQVAVMDSDFIADETHHPAYTFTSYESRRGATEFAPTPYELVTHRFYSMWGEWTLKPTLQIQHEVISIAVNGALPHLGDQMYPDGTLDGGVLETITDAFTFMRDREVAIRDFAPASDIAMVNKPGLAELYAVLGEQPLNETMGMSRLLTEGHRHVGFVRNLKGDLSSFSVVVLPDQAWIDDEEIANLTAYVENGGILLADGRTSLHDSEFRRLPNYGLADLLGIDWVETSPYSVNYFEAREAGAKNIPSTPILIRENVQLVNARVGTETLASVTFPLLETTSEKFVSHQHAPPAQKTAHPFLTVRRHGKGLALYAASHAGRQFWQSGCPWLKRLLLNSLHETGHDTRRVRVQAPMSVELTLRENAHHLAVHLTDYHGERPYSKMWSPAMRAAFIEEMPLRTDLTIEVRGSFCRAFYVPGLMELPLEQLGDSVRITIPQLHLHAAIMLEKDI